MESEELKKIAREYYSRKDIQKEIALFSNSREVIPRYTDNFGKRPDTINYINDIIALVKKGVTSFHSSEELWNDPLQLNTEMNSEKMNNLRKGWDLILDIDCKFVEYSKIAAELLIEAFKFYGIGNIGIKYSGNKGFHIGLSYEAFPDMVNDIEIKNFFPDGTRIIAKYLSYKIKEHLSKRILELTTIQNLAKRLGKKEEELTEEGKFNPYSILEVDTILISPRHLFRMPYSLHEKTGLASIVITPNQLKNFHPEWAKPQRVIPKKFLPKPEKDEAKRLFREAFDWDGKNKADERREAEFIKKIKKQESFVMSPINKVNIEFKEINPEFYPPCIKKISEGMKDDGRKRALFILINFLRSLNIDAKEIEIKIEEWNKLNYQPLKKGYISSQLDWFKKHKVMLPPNCDKQYYKGIGVCIQNSFCKKSRNPVYYAKDMLSRSNQNNKGQKKRKSFKEQ